jgi:hypothetical protein
VCGCDEPPFGLACLQSSALEPVDPSEELRVGEDRLDDLLSFAVKRRAPSGVASSSSICCASGPCLGALPLKLARLRVRSLHAAPALWRRPTCWYCSLAGNARGAPGTKAKVRSPVSERGAARPQSSRPKRQRLDGHRGERRISDRGRSSRSRPDLPAQDNVCWGEASSFRPFLAGVAVEHGLSVNLMNEKGTGNETSISGGCLSRPNRGSSQC